MSAAANNQPESFCSLLVLAVQSLAIPSLALLGLAMLGLSVPALGQSTSIANITSSQPSSDEMTATPLSVSEIERSTAWQLSETEWRRYQSLMLGIRGSVSVDNLSPIEVLGIHARDTAERRRYAEAWVRAMREDAERILAFQREYDAAGKRLYPGQALIDDQRLPGRSSENTALQRSDRVLFFASLKCPACDTVLGELLDRLDRIAGIDVYVMDVASSDNAAIRMWADEHGIKPEWVREQRVTLNHDAGALQRISTEPAEPPTMFMRRDEQLLPLSYSDL